MQTKNQFLADSDGDKSVLSPTLWSYIDFLRNMNPTEALVSSNFEYVMERLMMRSSGGKLDKCEKDKMIRITIMV